MESKWANLTDRLLMDKHIKIPIEKRFYLSFLENDETNINISPILYIFCIYILKFKIMKKFIIS